MQLFSIHTFSSLFFLCKSKSLIFILNRLCFQHRVTVDTQSGSAHLIGLQGLNHKCYLHRKSGVRDTNGMPRRLICQALVSTLPAYSLELTEITESTEAPCLSAKKSEPAYNCRVSVSSMSIGLDIFDSSIAIEKYIRISGLFVSHTLFPFIPFIPLYF